MCESFFREVKDASKIKGQIVAKYFSAWATIISNSSQGDVAYIDLFCGPGRYDDGTESTPLLVLKKAIENPTIHSRFISIFTDKEQAHIESLQNEINKLHGLSSLKNKPQVRCLEIGDQVVAIFKERKIVPSFVFLDPCGYKGLSLDLVNATIKDWACECLFFFNYNRINAAIDNDNVEEHVVNIFGPERAKYLRKQLIGLSPYKRETNILEALKDALRETHGKYIQSFCIKHDDRDRTSHYLIFVTKHFKGYEIMKEIMAKFSSYTIEDVPSFEFNSHRKTDLFDHPFKELKDTLLSEYTGKTEKMVDIYEQHSIGKCYIKKNYKQALLDFLHEDKIKVVKPDGKKPRVGTMPDDSIITFK